MAVRPSSVADPGRTGPATPRAPVRTCIGCRQRTVAAELLRVVAVDGTAVPDPRHRAPGRGAWLHPVPECVELAERRRAFARALRVPGPVDPAPVREYVTAAGSTTERTTQSTNPYPRNPAGVMSMDTR